MDLNEKVKQNEELKKLILKKRELIEEQKKELELLETQYNKQKESELPLLLFFTEIIDPLELPYPDGHNKFQSIYYLADLNIIKTVIDFEGGKNLPNTIDLRADFAHFNYPKTCHRNLYFNYLEIIERSALSCQNAIKEIIARNEFNSWEEVREYIITNRDSFSKDINGNLKINSR